jgi:RNA polymerase sigma-70 factor (ECF subfamily)
MTVETEARCQKGDEIEPASIKKSEAELIENARSNPRAFGQLYEQNYTRILNYVYRRTLDVTLAEEMTSNTFFKALRAMPRYRHNAPFHIWLYRIAGNELKMHWRAQKAAKVILQNPLNMDALGRVYFTSPEAEKKAEIAEKMRKFAELRSLLSTLPEKYQTVLHLRYFEKLQIKEISQVLGRRVGTVKSLIHRGLKRVRRLMEEQDATSP